MYHLTVASTGAAAATAHCPHTGQTGGGQCSANRCESYCGIFAKTCGSQSSILNNAGSSCLTACSNLTNGALGDVAGNTVECRAYHASFPSVANATFHCPHASISGGGACGSLCDTYCHFAINACTGTNQLYANLAACTTNCSAFSAAQMSAGSPGITDGDSLHCRIYHLSVAASQGVLGAAATTHCPHGRTVSATCAGTASTTTTTTTTSSTSATTGTGDSTRFGFLFVLSFLGMLLI